MNSSQPNHLRSRAWRAGSWTMFGYVASQLLRLGGNLVLTRLLVPEMFGIMALVTVIMMGLNLFSDFGLLQNIVRSQRGEDPGFLNTAWIVQIVRGVVLCLIGLLISFFFMIAGEKNWLPSGSVYADPVLPIVIAVVSILPIISGFNSTKLLVATRKLGLGRVTVLEITSQTFGLLVMIAWAWFEQTIWALVVGSIVTYISKMILSHSLLYGEMNRFEWDWKAFHEIFNFGKWIFISTILGYLFFQGDKLILGGLISSDLMGIYAIAFFLANAVTQGLSKLIGTVFYPVLSEVSRERPDKMSEVYYRVRLRVDAVTIFLAGFLFISGGTIVEVLYDERYIEAGWMLEVLSLSLVSTGFMMAGQYFLVLGHAKVVSQIIGIQLVVLYVTLPLLFSLYGIEGAVWAIALTPLAKIFGALWFMNKYKLLNISREFIMFPVILIGGIAGLGVTYLSRLILS